MPRLIEKLLNLMKISIKNKLIFIAIVSTLGLIIVGMSSMNGMSTVERLQKADTTLSELKASMLTLRRQEKDFLARKDEKYLAKFQETIVLSQQQLQSLKELLSGSNIDLNRIDAMGEILGQYESSFRTVVDFQRTIGNAPTSGLYGGLRSAVHEVEQQLKDTEEPQLFAAMLMLRRYEKDFMLRRDTKYVERFDQQMEQFTALAEEFLYAQQQARVLSLLEDYSRQFHQLVEAEKLIGLDAYSGAMGEMRSTVHQVETIFDELKLKMHDYIAEAVSSSNTWLLSTLVAVGVVVLLVTILVAVSIFTPLAIFNREIVNIIDTKDLSMRLTVHGNNEISEVARVFNDLLSVLHSMMEKINDAAMMVASSAEEMSMITAEVRNSTNSQSAEVE